MRYLLIVILMFWSGLEAVASSETRSVEIEQNGLTLKGRLVIADGAKLSDGVVLITHGTLAHMDMELIANMQRLLAERGINSLIHTLSLGLDARSGMYDCAVPFRGSLERDNIDIAAWLDWLNNQGAGKVTMMGHSRGAVQSARFVVDNKPANLASVVMLSPSAGQAYEKYLAAYDRRHQSKISELLKRANGLVAAGKPEQLMDVPAIM